MNVNPALSFVSALLDSDPGTWYSDLGAGEALFAGAVDELTG
jgi:hypothetical protein